MRKIAGILLMFLMVSSCDQGITEFQSQNFVKFFGNGYESMGLDVKVLSEGYVLVGYDQTEDGDNQVYVARVDKNGNLRWDNTIGKADVSEEGRVIIEVSDGYIIGGVTQEASPHSFLLKISSSGDSLWYTEVGDQTLDLELQDMTLLNDQVVVVGSVVWSGDASSDYYYAGYTLDGIESWEKSQNTGRNRVFKKVFSVGNGFHCFGDDGAQNRVAWAKYNSSGGNLDGKLALSDSLEVILDVVQSSDGYYVLTNNRNGTASSLYSFSATVVLQWSNPIEGMVGKALASTSDGSLVVMGETVDAGRLQINTMKVQSDGTLTNDLADFDTFPGRADKVLPTDDGGILMIGSTNATFGTTIMLIKTDSDLFVLKP